MGNEAHPLLAEELEEGLANALFRAHGRERPLRFHHLVQSRWRELLWCLRGGHETQEQERSRHVRPPVTCGHPSKNRWSRGARRLSLFELDGRVGGGGLGADVGRAHEKPSTGVPAEEDI